ncbi:acyl-CoA reductase [Bacillus sp. 7884-1]|uniref:acyl-CoA reductase n=1 Tax=Bacillus sp. 7884-1 TaxID=2021693 RepID=UPI000BA4FDAE|nr:acyl-CoA reductase [Bacillus sp. 7884-1]PAE38027.1 hypothetical protein CHI06_19165 [Bacillus sp. 7884-1]
MTVNNLFEPTRCIGSIEARAEAEKLRNGISTARSRPVSYYIDLLDAVGKLWSDPTFRASVLPFLATATGHSPELVELELDTVCKFLKQEYLFAMVDRELEDGNILDNWIKVQGILLRRHPRGLILHNLAGNALIVAPLSITFGLLTKNIALIKVPSDQPLFSTAFVRSLLSLAPELNNEISVLQWSGSDHEVFQTLFPVLDGAIHWGGEKSQHAISLLASEYDVPLLSHGPKFSFSYIDGLMQKDVTELAKRISIDIVLWEQKACSSPRFILVRSGDDGADAQALAESLAISLSQADVKWPVSRTDIGKSILVAAQRQQYSLKYGMSGQGKVLASKDPNGWTVVISNTLPDNAAINASTGRFIFVCPVSSSTEVLNYLKSYDRQQRKLLQVMAYEGKDMNFLDAATYLGVSRISRIGEMSFPAPGASHDGGYNLSALTTIHSCPE